MDPLVSGQAHHNKHKTKTPPTTIKPANFSHQPTFGVTSSSPSRSIAAESTQPSYRVTTDDPTPAAHNFEHRESTQSEHPASCSCAHCKNSVVKTVFAVLIVAIILILGVIGGIYIDREIILKSKVNTEQTRVNDAAVDAFVESDLIAKVSYLSMANSEEQPAYTSSYRVSNYEGIFTRFLDNTFNDADRLGVAVHSLMDEYQPADNSPYENFPEYIPAARVKERFISIFGTEPNIVPSNYCPGYIYDSRTDVFYVTKKCGNAATNPDSGFPVINHLDSSSVFLFPVRKSSIVSFPFTIFPIYISFERIREIAF